MLKQAVTANALFSGVSGAVLILARDRFSLEIPAPSWFFLILGIGLIGFAAQLAAMTMKPALARKLAMQVVASDVAWVVATSVALAVFYAHITALGTAMILTVNVIVAAFALLQYRGYVTEHGIA